MSGDFPSIWFELRNLHHKSLLIAGFYRQWTHENLPKSEAEQKGIEILTNQIELASNEQKDVIIIGDANLCSTKWKDPNFVHKNISTPLLNCLDQNGIKIHNVGNTYLADHILKNGTIPESALDHVYYSEATKLNAEVKKSDIEI